MAAADEQPFADASVDNAAAIAKAASITVAEAQVLRLLPTKSPFAVIADKLGISRSAAKERAERGGQEARRPQPRRRRQSSQGAQDSSLTEVAAEDLGPRERPGNTSTMNTHHGHREKTDKSSQEAKVNFAVAAVWPPEPTGSSKGSTWAGAGPGGTATSRIYVCVCRMILVDTSAWIEFLPDTGSPGADRVKRRGGITAAGTRSAPSSSTGPRRLEIRCRSW